MPVTQHHLQQAVEIARDFGATRLVLFGSAVEDPVHARDLDLAVAGVPGWEFFGLRSQLERTLKIKVDLVPLEPSNDFTRHIERQGRVLFKREETWR
jgi:predicted nucleotidyltransferase